MLMDGDDVVRLDDVKCLGETDKAIRVLVGIEQHWIPKSHVHDDSEVYGIGHEGTLVIGQWIAEQKGLDV